MGEYLNFDGEDVKIGTCENLYYLRYDFLKDNLDRFKAGDQEPKSYLSDGSRFRFPFPEEDTQQPFHYEKFDKGLTVPVDRKDFEIEHSTVTAHIQANGGGYGINYFIPCPGLNRELEIEHSNISERFPLDIVQLKPVGEEVWLVVRCGYCGVRVRFDYKESKKLTDHIEKLHENDTEENQDYWNKVCSRILEGYKEDLKQ